MSTQTYAGIQRVPLQAPNGLSKRAAQRQLSFEANAVCPTTGLVTVSYIDGHGVRQEKTCQVWQAQDGAPFVVLDMGEMKVRRTVFLQ